MVPAEPFFPLIFVSSFCLSFPNKQDSFCVVISLAFVIINYVRLSTLTAPRFLWLWQVAWYLVSGWCHQLLGQVRTNIVFVLFFFSPAQPKPWQCPCLCCKRDRERTIVSTTLSPSLVSACLHFVNTVDLFRACSETKQHFICIIYTTGISLGIIKIFLFLLKDVSYAHKGCFYVIIKNIVRSVIL